MFGLLLAHAHQLLLAHGVRVLVARRPRPPPRPRPRPPPRRPLAGRDLRRRVSRQFDWVARLHACPRP